MTEKATSNKKKIWRLRVVLFIKRLFIISVILFLIASGMLFFWIASLKIPDINQIEYLKIAQSTKIYDRTGEILLFNIYKDKTRTVVPLSEMSEHIINATIAVEDRDFFNHDGIKITSIIKAAFENITGARTHKRGGSTITQQVIKNTILTREKTYTRKIKEAILAFKLERLWTKEQILELYLNETPYGGTIYGVEEAARFYFGKSASELTILESAYLAAMPQAPTTYSPHGKNRHLLENRKNLILKLMLNQGFITSAEYKEARESEVEFLLRNSRTGIKAPHFVMYVIKQLEEKYGKEVLRNKGLKVITSLNYELQEKLEDIVKEKVLEKKDFYGVENAAVVVIETKTGNIISMVGSKDYFNLEIDGKVNSALAKRQPGSSFKPYIYLTAFRQGFTPETILWDVDTEFALKCDPTMPREEAREMKECYRPNNFDSHKGYGQFRGPMKLKSALPESINIPSVKLLYLVGIENAISDARSFGIKSLNKPAHHYGLNLVLGGGEVQLLNHVSAFGTFANEGIRVEPVSILEVRDSEGEIIFEHIVEERRVIDSKYVKNLNIILSTDSLKYPTFGYNSDLYFGGRVASKTGTTDNNRDSWTIGYDSGNIAVGVWVGNNDNSPANRNPGKLTYAIWRASVIEALKGYPETSFPEAPSLITANTKPVLRGISSGGVSILIDLKTGSLATENTPQEFIKEIIIPAFHSILHWIVRGDPNGPAPEVKDQAYEHWEYGVQKWIRMNPEIVKEEIQQVIDEILGFTSVEKVEVKDWGLEN